VVAPGEGGQTASKGWLVAAGLIGLAVLLTGIALPVGLWVRRRQRAGEAAGRAAVPGGQAKPEAARPSVSFPCPGCGKRLKGKAELAGKMVKCPHCGRPGAVPAITASPPRAR